MDEKLRKIQEFAHKALEVDLVNKPDPIEPEKDSEWRQLSSRKWEFRKNGIVLATIFHKPQNKFSLWFKTPTLYKKVHMLAADTFLFDSYDEAVENFPVLLNEHAREWVLTVYELLQLIK